MKIVVPDAAPFHFLILLFFFVLGSKLMHGIIGCSRFVHTGATLGMAASKHRWCTILWLPYTPDNFNFSHLGVRMPIFCPSSNAGNHRHAIYFSVAPRHLFST
jgi:hypothetical protein